MLVIEARGLTKRYRSDAVRHVRGVGDVRNLLTRRHTWALNGVDLRVESGETLGIVGRNGSGKSTLLRVIAGVTKPTSGTLAVRQPVTGFLTLGDSLAMDMTGAENAYTNALLSGLNRREATARLDEIAEFAELGDAMDASLRTYSNGMRLRLSFAVSAALDPKLLIVDEVLSVGDSGFMAKCIDRMHELQRRGVTALVTSHSLTQIEAVSSRVAWMDNGKIITIGDTSEVTQRYAEALARESSATLGSATEDLREGTGDATLTSIRLLHADGTEALVVRPDEALTVRLGYNAPAALHKPIFGFSIGHVGGGPRIVDLHTDADGHVIDLIEGDGAVEVTIGPMPLAGGDYALDAGIYASTWDRTFDHHYQALRFSVSAPNAPGPLAPRREWVHHPDAGAPPTRPERALEPVRAAPLLRSETAPAEPRFGEPEPPIVEPEHADSAGSPTWAPQPVRRTILTRMLLAASLYSIVAAIAFGPYVRGGTFISDDWSTVDGYRHYESGGAAALVRSLKLVFGGRPLLPYVLTAFPTILGTRHPSYFLAASIVLAVVTAALFATLLMTLKLPTWLAVGAGALALVFPWSDSTRLWPAVAANNVAVCLMFAAFIVGVRNARRPDGLVALAWESVAAAMLCASVLTYELTVGVAALAGIAYFLVLPRRSALWRWLLNALAALGGALYSALATTKTSAPWQDWVRHLRTVSLDAARLELRAVIPFGVPNRVRLLVLVVVAAFVVAKWRSADGRMRRAINWSAGLMAAGWPITIIGIAPTVPTAWFTPLSDTLDNRGNLVAMYGPIVTVLGLASLVVALTKHRFRGEAHAAALAGCVVLVAIGGQYMQRIGDDTKLWLTAAKERAFVVGRVAETIPSLPPDHVVYVTGQRGLVSRALPVFADSWDLGSALRLRYDDRTLRAYSVFAGAHFVCDPDGMRPKVLPGLHWDQSERGPLTYTSPYVGRDRGAPYGHITFVDVRTDQRFDVVDRATCDALLPTLYFVSIGP